VASLCPSGIILEIGGSFERKKERESKGGLFPERRGGEGGDLFKAKAVNQGAKVRRARRARLKRRP